MQAIAPTTEPALLDAAFYTGLSRVTASRLVKLSIHLQRMFMRCMVLPMTENQRFNLLSLQESSLMAVEKLNESHVESTACMQTRSRNEVTMTALLQEWEDFHRELKRDMAIANAVEFIWLESNGRPQAYWMGQSTHQF